MQQILHLRKYNKFLKVLETSKHFVNHEEYVKLVEKTRKLTEKKLPSLDDLSNPKNKLMLENTQNIREPEICKPKGPLKSKND